MTSSCLCVLFVASRVVLVPAIEEDLESGVEGAEEDLHLVLELRVAPPLPKPPPPPELARQSPSSRPIPPSFSVLARACLWCLGARMWRVNLPLCVKSILNSCLTPRILSPYLPQARVRRKEKKKRAKAAKVAAEAEAALAAKRPAALRKSAQEKKEVEEKRKAEEKAARERRRWRTLARPALPRVPLSTPLYGEKGYYTGARVRASRYGIR